MHMRLSKKLIQILSNVIHFNTHHIYLRQDSISVFKLTRRMQLLFSLFTWLAIGSCLQLDITTDGSTNSLDTQLTTPSNGHHSGFPSAPHNCSGMWCCITSVSYCLVNKCGCKLQHKDINKGILV